jgi:FkbH-like protein
MLRLTPEQLCCEWLAMDERCSALWFEQLLDVTLPVLGEANPALLAAALQAAGRRGDAAAVDRLLQARPLTADAVAVPAAFHLLQACRSARRPEIDAALDRLQMGGGLAPSVVALICQAMQKAGVGEGIPRVLRLCDLSHVSAKDVMRLRRFWTAGLPESWPAVRVWIAGAVTLDPVAPAMELGLVRHGLRPIVKTGKFGLLHQDLRDPAGEASQFKPDVVLAGYDVGSLTPEFTAPRRDLRAVAEAISAGIGRLGDSLQAWRRTSSAPVLLHTVESDALRRCGFADLRCAEGATAVETSLNAALARLCESIDGAHLLDLRDLFAGLGSLCRDDRRRFFGRFPYSIDALTQWGLLGADAVGTLQRGPRKVVVCDLDGTMWGGIVGDVGPMAVEVGPDHPGNAFLEFQQALLDLTAQGILLAVCSKNDPQTALAVFKDHPHMACRIDDVAACRIGWDAKPKLIQELAGELNLGLDSFVFLDDSPQERAAVRAALPMVLVPELPEDPVDRPRFIRSIRELWPLVLTESDRQRTQMYQAQKRSAELKASAGDNVEAFLQSLGQVLTVRPVGDGDWSRVAQMHVRTNQFNVTTRRHDETALRRMVDAGASVFVGSLQDCFGDQGIVITAVLVPEGDRWRIDTFLMSCRVVGRQVEAAFMRYLVGQARMRGIAWLDGEFIPTERNGPSAKLFESLGFAPAPSRNGESNTKWWELEVTKADIQASMVEIRLQTELSRV